VQSAYSEGKRNVKSSREGKSETEADKMNAEAHNLFGEVGVIKKRLFCE
jgi:hypothetical protein